MPKFHFHVAFPDRPVILDDDGEECPNLDAARQAAVLNARFLMADRLAHGEPPELGVYQVADASGNVLTHVTFYEALGLSDAEG